AQVVNGSLKKVDLSATAVAALHGARGGSGPQGIQGPQGPPGERGAQGLQGVQGVQGVSGTTSIRLSSSGCLAPRIARRETSRFGPGYGRSRPAGARTRTSGRSVRRQST